MDPRMYSRKGYDMDLTIFRSLFALDPNTNIPISTNWLTIADGIGGVQWNSLPSYMSTVSISNISMFDTTLTNNPYRHNITITNGGLFVDTLAIFENKSTADTLGNVALSFELKKTDVVKLKLYPCSTMTVDRGGTVLI